MSLTVDTIQFDLLDTDPLTPSEGQIWFNTTTKQLKMQWASVTQVVQAKNNATTSDPTVDNDSSQSYSVGSIWFNSSTTKQFICLSPSVGAAVWRLLTSSTPLDIGLGNVTDDAQLKRAAGDFNTFTEKTSIVGGDIFLLEDSADSLGKKKVKFSSINSYILFGGNVGYWSSDNYFTTTSGTYQDKLMVTTDALTGVFRVACFFQTSTAAADKTVDVQFYNVTDSAQIFRYYARHRLANSQVPSNGFKYITFAGAAKTFKVQIRTGDSGATVGISNVRVELWKVSA